MYDPLFERYSEEKISQFQKVYAVMNKFFNTFRMSRNPFTINWQLEILNILCIKFNLQETKLDNRLKKDYHDLFGTMLTNCAAILTDSFNIQFHETQVYQLAFPPTVYELLWRYEYITFKHTVQE